MSDFYKILINVGNNEENNVLSVIIDNAMKKDEVLVVAIASGFEG